MLSSQKISKFLLPKIPRNYSSTAASLVNCHLNEKSGVATVSMQRPPVNSLNLELLTELTSILNQLERDKARGLILTSSMNSVFSAGLDLMELHKPDTVRVKRYFHQVQETWIKLFGSSFPTVAAINGHSPAGGCLMAVACEYRVMVKGFTIGINDTPLGVIPAFWTVDSMLHTIGNRKAELALTTGQLFKTEEAFKIGLVDEVAEDKADAIEKAEKFLKRFERISPMARAATKDVLRGNIIKKLQNNREQDLNLSMERITDLKVQKILENYVQSLKSKKK